MSEGTVSILIFALNTSTTIHSQFIDDVLKATLLHTCNRVYIHVHVRGKLGKLEIIHVNFGQTSVSQASASFSAPTEKILDDFHTIKDAN